MPTFSKEFKVVSSSRIEWGDPPLLMSWFASGGDILRIKVGDLYSLREWWHTVLRSHGKYPCYAIFLVLSSDLEGTFFVQAFSNEIHHVSGKDCLVIVLGTDYFYTVGLQKRLGFLQLGSDNIWVEAHDKYITNGESIKIAELFSIELTELPCVVFFQDVRSSDFCLVSLKGLEVRQISKELREVFTVIRKAVRTKRSILDAIRHQQRSGRLHSMQNQIITAMSSLGNKTIETVIEAWVRAVLNPGLHP